MSKSKNPCSACKYLRRRCTDDCLLAAYFPPEEHNNFVSVHYVYGASNVVKLLSALEEHQRADAVRSFIHEAKLREDYSNQGVVGIISMLKKQLHEALLEVAAAREELAILQRQDQFYSPNPTGYNMMPSHMQQMVAVQPQHQQMEFAMGQDMLQNQQQQQENLGKSNVGFGEVGGLSSAVSSFNRLLIDETQQTHEQQMRQRFYQQMEYAMKQELMQFATQQEFMQKQQQQQESSANLNATGLSSAEGPSTTSMQSYLPWGGSHPNAQFQQDHSFPQPTDQFQQGVTIERNHELDQAHGSYSQIQGQDPVDHLTVFNTLSSVDKQQFLQSQQRLFAMQQQKQQQQQENLPKFNDGLCEVGGPSGASGSSNLLTHYVGGPSTALVQPYSTVGGFNEAYEDLSQSHFHPHSQMQQQYHVQLLRRYCEQLLQEQRTNMLSFLQDLENRYGIRIQLDQVQGTRSE